MTTPQNQPITLGHQQIAESANAGLRLLNLETTLIPGTLRRQLDVLEVVLQQLTTGQAILANPQPPQVELPEDPLQPEPEKPEQEV